MRAENPLTDVDFWVARQEPDIRLPRGGTKPSWFKDVASFFPESPAWTCLEVGVVPGGILLFFASELNYSCTGIDFSPRVEQLKELFSQHSKDATFICADFLEWQNATQFNLVYSCGFIEHFSDYEQVIAKQWSLVQPGGLMLLTVPVLTPMQLLFRRVFYETQKLQEVMDSHNLEIMDLERLRQKVKNLNNSKILVASFTSEMEIWFQPQSVGVRRWTRPLFLPLRILERIIHRIGVSSSWFSPNILVLARKCVDGE